MALIRKSAKEIFKHVHFQTLVSDLQSINSVMHSQNVLYCASMVSTRTELEARTIFLAKKFQGNRKEIKDCLFENNYIITTNREKFRGMTALLYEHGITVKEIMTYPDIYKRRIGTVESRIKEIKDGGVKEISLAMISSSSSKFKKKLTKLLIDKAAKLKFDSHAGLISTLLECSQEEAENIIRQSDWLKESRMISIKERINLLRSYNVPAAAIKDRRYLLVYPMETVKKRMEVLHENQIYFENFPKKFLPAIKLCDAEFKKSLDKLIEYRKILGSCKNEKDYLCWRFDCSEEHFKTVWQKCPRILSIKLPKLKKNLDLLLDECKFSSDDVMKNVGILLASNDTLTKRYNELCELGIRATCYVLKLDSKAYNKYVNKLSG